MTAQQQLLAAGAAPPASAAAAGGGKFVPRAQNAALPDGVQPTRQNSGGSDPDGDSGRFAGWNNRETSFGNKGLSGSQGYQQQQREPFWPSQQVGQQQRQRQQEEEGGGSPALAAGEGGADFWRSERQTSARFAGLTNAQPKQGVYTAPGSKRGGAEPGGSPGLGAGAALPGWRETRPRDAGAAERRPPAGGDGPPAHPHQFRSPVERPGGGGGGEGVRGAWPAPRARDDAQAPLPEPRPAQQPELLPDRGPDPAADLVFSRQWTFWLHRGVDACVPAHPPAAEAARHLAAVADASQFWAAYTHLKHPSDVPVGTSYLLLCEGLPPLASQLPGAGRFLLRVRKGDSASCVWEEMLLRCVGEQWEPHDEVIGAAVSVLAEEDVVELWTRNGGWAEAVEQLHQQFCSLPPAAAVISVQYEPLSPPHPQHPLMHPLGMGGGQELAPPHPFHPAAAYGAHMHSPLMQQPHFQQQAPSVPVQHPAGGDGYAQQPAFYAPAEQPQHWRQRPHGGRMS